MKAIQCVEWAGPEKLVVAEVPLPEPGAGEVRVRVEAAGVNFPDALIVQKKYQVQPPLPFTPGAEVAGTVDAVGAGVKHVKAGDRVGAFVGLGGFAEFVCAPAAMTAPLPPGVSTEAAAAFTLTYATSHHALFDRGQLKAGETLLVLGAGGGVGIAAVELGKIAGARVIAAASSDEKLAAARAHGADAVINYASGDLREAIKATTEVKGVDVVYDPVGGKHTEAALRSLAWRGRLLVVGFADGTIPQIPANLLLIKGASAVGVFWGDFARREPQANQKMLAELFGWLAQGRLKPHISQRYPLADTPRALEALLARKAVGKLVINP
ncbi:MAG TPA: NADPH:quinone oxidoreductase family protein [Burkholderiaceae bacterium]|nr:NADPH:quinone oxidoreductase family protein [Burkholderiaceae bacterium]HQR70854.1 NADPH:quinone oxidoreductase family protein [Burkholderiaceae bacterium]